MVASNSWNILLRFRCFKIHDSEDQKAREYAPEVHRLDAYHYVVDTRWYGDTCGSTRQRT